MPRLRTVVGWGMVGLGLVVMGISLAMGLTALRAYSVDRVTGDWTGVALTRHMIVVWLLPLAGVLVLAGLLIGPPARLQRWWRALPARPPHAQPVLAHQVRAPISRRDLAGFALLSATALGLATVGFVVGEVVDAARYYGYGAVQLAVLALQNLVLMAPVLILGGLLAWVGLRAHRRG
jgi:hypothetical protein